MRVRDVMHAAAVAAFAASIGAAGAGLCAAMWDMAGPGATLGVVIGSRLAGVSIALASIAGVSVIMSQAQWRSPYP